MEVKRERQRDTRVEVAGDRGMERERETGRRRWRMTHCAWQEGRRKLVIGG